jgi:hypothetical protein
MYVSQCLLLLCVVVNDKKRENFSILISCIHFFNIEFHLLVIKHSFKLFFHFLKKKNLLTEVKMRFLKNFKIKLFVSLVIGILASLYQMETREELHVTQKVVMLNKNRQFIYDFLTKVDDYPRVSRKILQKFDYFK